MFAITKRELIHLFFDRVAKPVTKSLPTFGGLSLTLRSRV